MAAAEEHHFLELTETEQLEIALALSGTDAVSTAVQEDEALARQLQVGGAAATDVVAVVAGHVLASGRRSSPTRSLSTVPHLANPPLHSALP